ncbi:MAG: NADH-quinone oxidoreductase subunit NuoN [Aquabacterium sp.]
MMDMNWIVVYPEALLLGMACVIALLDLWVTDPQRRPTFWLTQATFAAVALLNLVQFQVGLTAYGMENMVVVDPMGRLLGFFASLAMMATVAYARPYIAERDMLRGEFFVLAMFVLLGILVMLSANSFLTIYLGLEVMSLSLYALVALRRDHAVSTEAAMKYFVLGALASGFLLYGLSMMYGATRSLDIREVFAAIGSGQINAAVLTLGTVFIVSGLAFKLGVVPFHMWVPDVYQGAPTAVTLMIGGAPKLAAFGITIRLLVEGLFGLAVDWQQMLIVLAVCSLVVGNFAAIAQTNLKRMLAYSTISQMGFMLLAMASGVVAGNTYSALNAYSSAMFYVVTYVLTTLGTFGLIMLLSRKNFECEQVSDLAGLNQRSPWMAGVMAVFMFSLAGMPPMVGFYAKLAVLQALITTDLVGYLWLAGIAVVLSLVGAFYYLRIVKIMYFDNPLDSVPMVAHRVGPLLALNGLAVLGLGLLPGGLMNMCKEAIRLALAS